MFPFTRVPFCVLILDPQPYCEVKAGTNCLDPVPSYSLGKYIQFVVLPFAEMNIFHFPLLVLKGTYDYWILFSFRGLKQMEVSASVFPYLPSEVWTGPTESGVFSTARNVDRVLWGPPWLAVQNLRPAPFPSCEAPGSPVLSEPSGWLQLPGLGQPERKPFFGQTLTS